MEINDQVQNSQRESYRDCNVIRFKELKVWTPEETSWWRPRVTKSETIILSDVTGCIKDGEFVAVIGPSGAGKTTFLICLAGKCTLPSSGAATVRGRNVRELQGIIEIVPQNEVFMNHLTVMEHLIFMTEMKLGSCKKPTNRMTLNTYLTELKLKDHAHTRVDQLSGGERKLLSLAGSLLSSPQILICDEPTTGLDSYNASLVIRMLKKIALSGKTVVCSVHQPSSDVFKEFSSVMLMADGKLLFHGTQRECQNAFERLNLYCPKNYNPAEFYIRAVSNTMLNENYSDKVKDIHREQSWPIKYNAISTEIDVKGNSVKRYQRNWLKQLQLLLWRSSLSIKRDMREHIIQLVLCMTISSIVIGTCYVGITGTTQSGVQDLRGFLWLVCSEVSFSISYTALYAFGTELTLFRREVGMYSGSAYFVATFLNIVPRCIIWPVSFVIVATLLVELPNHVVTAIKFIVALFAIAITSTAYGLGMGAMFTSTGLISDVMPCADLPLFLMSGAFLRISSVPFWLYPLKYLSHFYYGMDALSNIYWRQIDYIECPSNTTDICVKDGAAVLSESGYSSNFLVEDSCGFLLVTALWSLVGYYALKREEKKGYAY